MANRYNFDKSINRRLTHSYKWDVNEDTLSFTVADTDFEVAKEIQDAIKNRADMSTYGYTYVPDEYFEAYIHWWKSRYGLELKKEWFIFSTSIVASIDSVLKRISNIGDGVALFTPNYNVFFNCITNNKRKVVEVPFIYENYEYSIDWELLENSLKESKVFIHCNPHNPIGKQFTYEDNKKIIELCKKYDVYLITDEIHSDLDYNENRYNPLLKSGLYEKAIMMVSPGKSFNLAGLHSSVMIVHDKSLKKKLEKGVYEDDIGEPNYFSIEPVIAAYTKAEQYVAEENEYIAENRRILKEFIDKSGLNIQIVGGHATYLLWLDVSSYSHDSVKLYEDLKNKVNIVVAPGANYHEHFSTFIRVNIATQRDNIYRLCEALKLYFNKGE